MFEHYQIRINDLSSRSRLLNALLTLATGVLTLSFPNFLYLIAGVYLISLGLIFLTFKLPGIVSALPIVSGLLIFIFPELIPITFASFLALFGLVMLFAFHFSILGILTIITAVLIMMNPDSVAYFIAFFMLIYAVSNLISYYKEWQNDDTGPRDDGEIIIE